MSRRHQAHSASLVATVGLALSCRSVDVLFINENIEAVCSWTTACLEDERNGSPTASEIRLETSTCEETYESERNYYKDIDCIDEYDAFMDCLSDELDGCDDEGDICYESSGQSAFNDLNDCENDFLQNTFGELFDTGGQGA